MPRTATWTKPRWMWPKYFVNNTGTQTVAAAKHFGSGIACYTIEPTHASVSINSLTGVISVVTTTDFAWKEFTVYAARTDGVVMKAVIELRVLTGTKTIDLGASQSYWSVTPVAGDIVLVRAGSSAEQWFLNGGGWDVGTASQPIECVAYPGEKCVINASGLSVSSAIYAGDNTDLIIRGLELIGGPTANYGVETWKSSRITIEQCILHGGQRFGIVGDADGAGVCSDNIYRYNVLYNNVRENSARSMSSGFGSALRANLTTRAIVSRNVSFNNYGEGVALLACNDSDTSDNIIYDNYSVNHYIDGGRFITASRNIAWANDSNYYKSGVAAASLAAANEAYGNYYEQTTKCIKCEFNNYLSTNNPPLYGSWSIAGGGGEGSYYKDSAAFAAVDSAWPMLQTPTVASRTAWVSATSDSTSHAPTMPSATPGNMLIAFFSVDGNPTCTASAGWTKLGQASNSTIVTQAVFYKIASGSDTLTVTTSASEQSSCITIEVSNARTITGANANGSSTNSDPPNLAPTYSLNSYSINYLWLVSRGGDSTTVATVAPTNYSNLQTQAAGGTSGASTNTAERTLSATSENPGTFTSGSEQWVSWTVAVCNLPLP